MPMDIGLRTRK